MSQYLATLGETIASAVPDWAVAFALGTIFCLALWAMVFGAIAFLTNERNYLADSADE